MMQLDQQMEWAEACSLAASDNSALLDVRWSVNQVFPAGFIQKNYGQKVDHGQYSNLRPLWSAGQETGKGQYSMISTVQGEHLEFFFSQSSRRNKRSLHVPSTKQAPKYVVPTAVSGVCIYLTSFDSFGSRGQILSPWHGNIVDSGIGLSVAARHPMKWIERQICGELLGPLNTTPPCTKELSNAVLCIDLGTVWAANTAVKRRRNWGFWTVFYIFFGEKI